MRVLYLLMFSAILSACNTFNVVPGYSPYVSLNPPTIQHWQKPNTIGRTNVDKRWQDAKKCGVKTYRDGNLDLSVRYPGMTTEQIKQRSEPPRYCRRLNILREYNDENTTLHPRD